ncbi:hypothetical protein [Salinispira pacifica]
MGRRVSRTEALTEVEMGKLERRKFKQLLIAFDAAGAAVGFWLMFYRSPPWPLALVGLLMPLAAAALMIRHPAIWFAPFLPKTRKGVPPIDPLTPHLFFSVVAPPVVLCYKSLVFEHLEDASQLPLLSLVVAVPLMLAGTLFMLPRRSFRRWWGYAGALVVLGVCVAIYAPSLVLGLNRLLDNSSPVVYQTAVASKQQVPGSKGSARYYLMLNGWVRRPEGYSSDVPWYVYNRVSEGAWVTVYHHSGRLGIPWFAFSVNGYRF